MAKNPWGKISNIRKWDGYVTFTFDYFNEITIPRTQFDGNIREGDIVGPTGHTNDYTPVPNKFWTLQSSFCPGGPNEYEDIPCEKSYFVKYVPYQSGTAPYKPNFLPMKPTLSERFKDLLEPLKL
jgi:hypothetical protein